MTRFVSLFGLLILQVLILGCSRASLPAPDRTPVIIPSPTKPPVAPREEQLQWIFQENLCGQSCWNGIIPGKTTTNELIAYLRQAKDVTGLENLSDLGLIEWEDSQGTRILAILDFTENEPPIEELSILLPRNVTLNDIMAYIGDPSQIAIVATSNPHPESTPEGPVFPYSYVIYLIYPTQGIALGYWNTQPPELAEITGTSIIREALITGPNTVQRLVSYVQLPKSTPLLEWEGANTLSYYCNRAYPDSPNISVCP